jgi:hypothetical protein
MLAVAIPISVTFTDVEHDIILPVVDKFNNADMKGWLRIAQQVASKIKKWNRHLSKPEWEARKKVHISMSHVTFAYN